MPLYTYFFLKKILNPSLWGLSSSLRLSISHQMFLRTIFFKRSLVLNFFYTSSKVGFVSSELSKRKARKEKMCTEKTMLFALCPCTHAVPQGLGRGPDSQYVGGGVNVPCHARKRTEQDWTGGDKVTCGISSTVLNNDSSSHECGVQWESVEMLYLS